jgi:hypothetical protein
MNWLAVIVVVALGFIGWELTETGRLQRKAMRKRERQNAASDRGDDEPKTET